MKRIIFSSFIGILAIISSFSFAFAAGSISGKVTLQSRTNHQKLITFKLTKPGQSTPLNTYNTTTTSDGSYALTDIPTGIYNLSAKASNFLSQNQVLIEVTEGQTTPNIDFALLGGDCDGNNVVSLRDFSILRAAYRSSIGSPRWNEEADFNGNGQIDLNDFSILRSNYGKSGTEPKIIIISPPDNSLTNLPTAYMLGIVDDNTVQVSVNGLPVPVINYTFGTSNLTLNEGQNKITAVAVNKYGIKNADLVIVVLDTTAPVITISSPQDGYISTTQTITVSGTIDDDQAAVRVNNIDATVSDGAFGVENVPLNDAGQPTIITATATDLVGNSSTPASITVTYQPTVTLAISITSPVNNAIVNTPIISVSGTVTDNTATVTVNGIPATVTNNTFTASNVLLTQGTNTITATAVTDTSNATNTVNVTLDQEPPSITIHTPDNNVTTRSNIVYGRVSEDTQSVTVNGIPAELIQNNHFIARPPLSEGQNTITVQAQDKAGNTNQKSINITYNTQTPKVTITSPQDNSEINISPINIEGTNTQDIQFILVELQTALINEAAFIAEDIALNPIKTIITASGYDTNNNKFSDSIVVTSPNLQHYELTNVLGDATEDDPNRPTAGSNQILKVKLNKNNLPSPNEEVQFRITQGQGTLSSISSFTDINGEATITLTLDTNSDITNQVECFPTANPLLKTTFSVDTKPGLPSILTKITDDSITPVPGATIDLIVKLTDQYNNIISDEQINFQITQGTGTLSSPSASTNYYGEAKTNLTTPSTPNTLTQIRASSNTDSSVNATFNITTSEALVVTIDEIINKVNLNDSKIQDIKADITVTSNAPFLPSTMQLKIWQKGDKQKVEEISPNPQVKIRPPLETSTESVEMQREIISYDPSTNIYVIKAKQQGQAEEYPYQVFYIDYNKGVELESEYYTKDGQLEMIFVTEAKDFIQINDAWVFQKLIETAYEGQRRKELYRTENIYTNIQINTGIPDSEFQ